MSARASLFAVLREKGQFIPNGFRDDDGVWHDGPHSAEFATTISKLEYGWKRLRLALEQVLDAAERDRAGFSIESEEWYTRRDFARIVLEDTK
jgi:hypothetical protein